MLPSPVMPEAATPVDMKLSPLLSFSLHPRLLEQLMSTILPSILRARTADTRFASCPRHVPANIGVHDTARSFCLSTSCDEEACPGSNSVTDMRRGFNRTLAASSSPWLISSELQSFDKHSSAPCSRMQRALFLELTHLSIAKRESQVHGGRISARCLIVRCSSPLSQCHC